MPKRPRKAPVDPPPEEQEEKKKLPLTPVQLFALGLFACFAGVKLLFAISAIRIGEDGMPMLGSGSNQVMASAAPGAQNLAPGPMTGEAPQQPMQSGWHGGGGGSPGGEEVADASQALGPDGKPVPGASASPGADTGEGGAGDESGVAGGAGAAAGGGTGGGVGGKKAGSAGGAGGNGGGAGGAGGSKTGAGGGNGGAGSRRTVTAQAWANKRQNFPVIPRGIRTPYALNTRIRQAKKRAEELENAARNRPAGSTADGPLSGDADGELGRLQCDLKHTFQSMQSRFDKDNAGAEQAAREALDCRDRINSKSGRKGVDDWEAHVNLAAALEAQGRTNEAQSAMTDAIRAAEASLSQVNDDLSSNADRPDLAETQAQLQQDLVNLEVNLAIFTMASAGDPDAARDLLQSALDRVTNNGRNPDNPDAKRVQDLLSVLGGASSGDSPGD